mmetsp:Transcript_23988/g.43906  ORF Transcript_23988/g.43906 Transcript_23988/m.43906 type:complete len:381 (+) Transcript_23988:891-2033(+)
MNSFRTLRTAMLGASALVALGTMASADQVFADDLIVQGSACIGIDCANGESFGFDTIRLKENNLRIKAQDTSTSASFPTVDWQITFNDSGNGGANKFAIDDIDNNRTPFTIEASARSNALYVDDGGRIGLGTSTPVVDLHAVNGNSPTLRLEQDGSSGFTPQTFDIAANEANFFVRDVTNGSTLPLRIEPSAPTDALYVEDTGDIGIGTNAPERDLHIRNTGSSNAAQILLEQASAGAVQIRLETTLENNRRILGMSGGSVQTSVNMGDTAITLFGSDINTPWLEVTATGISVSGTDMNVPDYVFEPDYDLRPLRDVQAFIIDNKHLPDVPSAKMVQTNGLNMSEMQLTLLRKVEELTLYTLEQQDHIDTLTAQVAQLTK